MLLWGQASVESLVVEIDCRVEIGGETVVEIQCAGGEHTENRPLEAHARPHALLREDLASSTLEMLLAECAKLTEDEACQVVLRNRRPKINQIDRVRWLANSNRAIWLRWTSSGPSAKRSVRACA